MQPSPPANKRRKIPHWLVVAITYAISIASLAWALRGYDFTEIKPAILSVRWIWVLAAVILELAVYVFQSWRWITLLSPVERPTLWDGLQAIYIGLFASDVLPLRPGELIRGYLLSVWAEIPISLTLTSMVIERVLDGIWLVAAFWLATSFMNMPAWLVDLARLFAAGVLALGVLFVYVLFRKQHAHSLLSARNWGRKFLHVLDQIHQLGSWRTLGAAFGITFFYWAAQVFPIWALFRSYDMDLSLWAATAVVIVKSIGTAVPSAPGNFGVLQSVVKLALTGLGVEANVAFELSNLIWVATTLPLLAAGFLAVLFTGADITQIHRHAHHGRQLATPSAPGSR